MKHQVIQIYQEQHQEDTIRLQEDNKNPLWTLDSIDPTDTNILLFPDYRLSIDKQYAIRTTIVNYYRNIIGYN